jgi:glycosyltransferase involved in cell wall biosynthesis
VVFVMNYRFLPSTLDDAYMYGVVQHVVRSAEIAERHRARVGLVLYDRDDSATEPHLSRGVMLGRWPFVRLRYAASPPNCGAGTNGRLTDAIRRAVGAIHARWNVAPDQEPYVLYFQTGSMLAHAPPECRVVVTHHSPFVLDVADVVGWEAARRAFDWDHAKTDYLARTQAEGLEFIKTHARVRCAEISAVQRRYLRRIGVGDTQVADLPPPVGWGAAVPPPHAGVDALLARCDPRTERRDIAVLAVSRFDGFKNVDLFLHAVTIALQDRQLRAAVVIGGDAGDRTVEALRCMIPAAVRARVAFLGRLPRSVLIHRVFRALRDRAVFVCCSHYDLVPYTALEAARAGLPVIAPDTASVGVSEYLPDTYRFEPSPPGLVEKLRQLGGRPSELDGFASCAAMIAEATSDERFVERFSSICGQTR